MKVMIIGSGGREHAIAYKVLENSKVDKIYCVPGNGGTASMTKCENVNIKGNKELADFAEKNNIDLTVVGPEVPLTEGLVNEFKARGLKAFGPAQNGAMLEGSKVYSKAFMKKYGIKTAAYETFEDKDSALTYLKTIEYPVVIKADGLAAGKGVVICEDYQMAENTIIEFMVEDIFQGSGKKIIVEEFLEGPEASILSITDGEVILPFISAKDHKQIFDGGKGPNTGGMGAIAPNPYYTKDVMEDFENNIMAPTLKGIKEEGLDYTGIIFFGVMITKKGAYLLEYNVRLGDPETQAVLPLMKSDFVDMVLAALDKNLKNFQLQWHEGASCCVVAASKGYPGNYEKGFEINGIEECGRVFAAGVSYKDGKFLTDGGRVLCTQANGSGLPEAIEKAYEDMEKIKFDGIYFRKDIGRIY
ncbi:MAG: phosphoribosylamine--glycine ligase [Solirubrobacterales bacterium]